MQYQKQQQQQLRPMSFWEKQKYFLAYGAAISLFAPPASAYQLSKLYKINLSPAAIVRSSLVIYPHQTILKMAQIDISTPIKQYCNPFITFACMGVLQGGIYGQSNIHFSKYFKIGKVASMKGMFRGSVFAAMRDSLSQGLPFVFSDPLRRNVVSPLLGQSGMNNKKLQQTSQMVSVFSTSVLATYMSQGFHNLQIKMQSNQTLSYAQTINSCIRSHGASLMWKGAEARVGLLLVVNLLNEICLKPAWNGVPVKN